MQFPQLRKQVSVAAGATVNVLADELVSQLPVDAYMQVGIGAAAAGVYADVVINGEIRGMQDELPIVADYPAFPAEFYLQNEQVNAARLNRINVRNSTGGALVVWVHIRTGVTPLGT